MRRKESEECEDDELEGADGECWEVEFVKVSVGQGAQCRRWSRTVKIDGRPWPEVDQSF